MSPTHATPWVFVLPGVFSFVLTTALAISIASRSWRFRVVRPLSLWLLAGSVWSLGYALELRALDIEAKLFWDNLQWLACPVWVSALVAFCFRYAGADALGRWLTRFAALSGGGATLALLQGSTSGSLRASARMEYIGSTLALAYDFTVWDQLATSLFYAWSAAGVLELWRFRRTQPPGRRWQTTLVLSGILLPAPLVLSTLFGPRLPGHRDFGPVALALGAVLVFWGMHRRQPLDLVPLARACVLDAMPDPVVVLDLGGRILALNRAAAIFSVDPNPLGRTVSEAMPALRGVSTGDAADRAGLLRGPERTLVARVLPVPDSHGRPLARALVLRDVTATERLEAELETRVRARTEELVRATEELRASETKLRAVFNGTPTLIALLDVEGRVLAANRAALALAGVGAGQVLGRPFADGPWWSNDAGERQKLRGALQQAQSGTSGHFQTTHRSRNGKLRSIDVVITPFHDADKQLTWLISEGRDTTPLEERERLDAELARRQRHAERFESLGRLAGGVAHDFNNLLSVIMGNGELLAREVPQGSFAQELVADIQKATASASMLTRQLLALSKRPAARTEVLEVDEHLKTLSKLLKRLLGEAIALELQLEAGAARARLPAGEYEQIVINLVVNAQEALGGCGRIRVHTFTRYHETAPSEALGPLPAPGNYVVTSVSDDGPGIPAELAERAFEPFVTTKETGTGLGLSTVYAVSQRAGGVVCLYSAPGAGTRVEVHLPEFSASLLPEAAQEGAASCAGRRVLVVEDREDVRRTLSRALEHLGCSAVAVEDAERALSLAAEGRALDVLLTDVCMPNMSGPELAERVTQVLPTLSVVFMSGRPPGEDVKQWMGEKGARFVQKPVSLDELARVLAGANAPP